MHGEIFLNRKVFITSVVAASPKKTVPSMSGTPGTGDLVPLTDQNSSPVATTTEASSSTSQSSPTNKSIFDHIRVDSSSSESDSFQVPKTSIQVQEFRKR